jgi:triacylglycerol esterase/lipase EstA (alpha/beta hydrolase family)
VNWASWGRGLVVAVSAGRGRWSGSDTGLLVSVLLAAAVWCWWFSWRGSVPFEDAKMLFRYVDNVVAGHGVVWNVGEARSPAQPIWASCFCSPPCGRSVSVRRQPH